MEIRKAVEEHQADFGITSAPFSDLDVLPLFTDHMVAITKNPLASESIVDLNLSPERLIFCKAAQETTMELLKRHRINLTKSFIVQQPETVMSLVEKQNGIGIISALVLDHTPNEFIRYPITPAIPIDIGLIAHNLNDLTPAALELKKLTTEFALSLSSKQ